MIRLLILGAVLAAPSASAPTCPDTGGWLALPNKLDLSDIACYWVSDYASSWDAASHACKQMSIANHPVELASIHSMWENAFVFDNVTNKHTAWLGLNKREQDDWHWEDKTREDFQFWLAEFPVDNDMECATFTDQLNSRCGEWVNADCATNLYFVCKTPAA
ncbi:lectin BRA-3-like isoform X1 [Pollicipes pollicipes]|uniref:lectin BRA-3-like isoform X1 n=1 Tax=Pollicipes pollicipes TaxID=41117 RepID=UPI00188554F3|nr:lectin BRA-3-like isoform X1 [Pollicipes pollicipes]